MYNKNICCNYIRIYNYNKYFYYTRRCIIKIFVVIIYSYIITTNIFIIHETVFLLYETMYNNNIYLLLYKKIYNNDKHFS